MYRQVLLVFLLMIGKYAVHVSSVITCDAPAVQTGEPASVTCHFDVDVSVAKKNIKVQRRPLTSSGFDPDTVDTVLDCYWQNALDLSCQFGNGFKLIGEPGKTAVVQIASATKEDEQFYTCEVVPSDPSNIRSCKLTVKDIQAWDGNFSFPNYVPGHLEDETAKVKGILTAVIIIVIIIGVIIILVLVILLILFRKQLKENVQTCCKWESPHKVSSRKNNIEDSAAVPMLSLSKNTSGDQDSSVMGPKEKERNESNVRQVHNIKAQNVDRAGEGTRASEAKGIPVSSPSQESREHKLPNDPQEVQIIVERAGGSIRASETKGMPSSSQSQESREHMLPNDPQGLQISVEEWYKREEAEVNRKKEEIKALKELYAAKEEEQKLQGRKKDDERMKIIDPNKYQKRQKTREEELKKIKEKRTQASNKLETLRKRHDEERKHLEEEDKKRHNLNMEPKGIQRKK